MQGYKDTDKRTYSLVNNNQRRKEKMKYLYPKNLKSKANLWLWGLKDFGILCISALISVLAFAGLKIYLPAVITLCYGFLTFRKDDATVMYYIKYAVRYFITEQQTYKLR